MSNNSSNTGKCICGTTTGTCRFTGGECAIDKVGSGLCSLPKRVAKTAFDRTMNAMQPETATHVINASKEVLMAARSFVDRELEMADRALRKQHRRMAERDGVSPEPQQDPPAGV